MFPGYCCYCLMWIWSTSNAWYVAYWLIARVSCTKLAAMGGAEIFPTLSFDLLARRRMVMVTLQWNLYNNVSHLYDFTCCNRHWKGKGCIVCTRTEIHQSIHSNLISGIQVHPFIYLPQSHVSWWSLLLDISSSTARVSALNRASN